MADGGGALGVLLHTHVSPGMAGLPLHRDRTKGWGSTAIPEMGYALNICVASASWSPGDKAEAAPHWAGTISQPRSLSCAS